jgi:D-Tyr-tRNAtyr deacylase
MRAVVQRVTRAQVSVDGHVVGAIDLALDGPVTILLEA